MTADEEKEEKEDLGENWKKCCFLLALLLGEGSASDVFVETLVLVDQEALWKEAHSPTVTVFGKTMKGEE